jgi:dienelactone hydrolase
MKIRYTLLLLVAPLMGMAQFPVGHRTITYVDASRNNRQIACEVYYPATAAGDNQPVATGSFPVVALGHGFLMAVGAYANWYNHLAPRGYILILPTTEGGLPPSHGDFGQDLRFVANEMVAAGSVQGGFWSFHVSGRIGIMGHSMGGGATILAAANNPDVDCVVTMAAAETTPSAQTAASGITAPTLMLYGTSDNVTPEADHGLPMFNNLGSSCSQYVRLANGSHCFFADFNFTCSLGETIPGSLSREDQHAKSFALVDPWLDYFLKDDCAAWQTLQTAENGGVSGITVTNECPNPTPVITDQGGTLTSTAAPQYQWYLDGQPIPNAIGQTHVYTQSGTYHVEATNVGNCPLESNSIVISITGLTEAQTQGPRYAEGRLLLPAAHGYRSLSITDAAGRTVYSGPVVGNMMDLPLPQGTYLILLESYEDRTVLKVVR